VKTAGASGKFSLLILLPLALLTLIFLAGLVLSVHNRRLLANAVEREADKQIVHDLTLTQGIVNEQLRQGTVTRAQQTLAIYGARADMHCAFLVDHQEQVLASARRDHIGLDFRNLLPPQLIPQQLFSHGTLREIAATQIGRKELFGDAEMIAGVFPVRMGIKPGELRPTRTGFIIFVRDLAQEKHARIAWQQHGDWLLGTILAGLLIGLGLCLHFLVTKRLHKIAMAAGQVEQGDLEARSGVTGKDEIGALAHAFDSMVDERSNQEQTILKLNEELEQRVQRRTAALEKANRELVKAEKLSTLGQLSGGVAHELRTPLGVLSHALYFLKETLSRPGTDPEIVAALEESDRALNNSRHIIDEMLDYGRGARPAQAVEFSLQPVIAAAIEGAKLPPGITISVEGDDSITAMAAPDQVERILGNLIRNAVEATQKVGAIRITAHEQDHAVEITVADDGPGIPPADLDRIFEPLFSRKTTGIGLGLALSKRYAELNAGELVAANGIERGAVFRLTLPAAIPQPDTSR
jgi:signal transduction histidine kinase